MLKAIGQMFEESWRNGAVRKRQTSPSIISFNENSPFRRRSSIARGFGLLRICSTKIVTMPAISQSVARPEAQWPKPRGSSR